MIDITNIYYPCYVSPIYDNKIIYIPTNNDSGLYNVAGEAIPNSFLKLQKIKKHVLEGYLVDKQLKFLDCIPLSDFNNKKCKLIYEDRLTLLRSVLNDTLADYKKYLEVPNYLVNNPNDVKELYSRFLTKGYKGVTIIDVNGTYTFGANSSQRIELTPNKGSNNE